MARIIAGVGRSTSIQQVFIKYLLWAGFMVPGLRGHKALQFTDEMVSLQGGSRGLMPGPRDYNVKFSTLARIILNYFNFVCSF